MKTILSFLRPVSRGLNWVGRGLQGFWRVNKFYYFPTKRNLLVSYWYDFQHFKSVRGAEGAYVFLDSRVNGLKRAIANLDDSPGRRQLYHDFLKALYRRPLREMIVTFLESPSPENYCQTVIDAMSRAWRMGEEEGLAGDDLLHKDNPNAPLLTAGTPLMQSDPLLLNAKTYFIAADIHFEMAGKETEFQVLSRKMPELTGFIRQQFGVSRLPGTFEKLKGYNYKTILTGRNEAKKGQLKPHFRQIARHPEVFGETIAGKAREILAEYFD